MLEHLMTVPEMRKESRRLIKNLSRRMDRIEKRGLDSTALRQYRKLDIPKKITDLTPTQLRVLTRDLKYINDLKSSTVKGAQNILDTFKPIEEKLLTLSESTRGKFWESYSKLVDLNSLMYNFKYDVFDTIMDEIMSGVDTDTIVKNIDDLYRESVKEGGDDEFAINEIFSSKLLSR